MKKEYNNFGFNHKELLKNNYFFKFEKINKDYLVKFNLGIDNYYRFNKLKLRELYENNNYFEMNFNNNYIFKYSLAYRFLYKHNLYKIKFQSIDNHFFFNIFYNKNDYNLKILFPVNIKNKLVEVDLKYNKLYEYKYNILEKIELNNQLNFLYNNNFKFKHEFYFKFFFEKCNIFYGISNLNLNFYKTYFRLLYPNDTITYQLSIKRKNKINLIDLYLNYKLNKNIQFNLNIISEKIFYLGFQYKSTDYLKILINTKFDYSNSKNKFGYGVFLNLD